MIVWYITEKNRAPKHMELRMSTSRWQHLMELAVKFESRTFLAEKLNKSSFVIVNKVVHIFMNNIRNFKCMYIQERKSMLLKLIERSN